RSYCQSPVALSRRLNLSEMHMHSIRQTTDPRHRLALDLFSSRHKNKVPLEAAVVNMPGSLRERKFRHAGKLLLGSRNAVDEVHSYVMLAAKTMKVLFI